VYRSGCRAAASAACAGAMLAGTVLGGAAWAAGSADATQAGLAEVRVSLSAPTAVKRGRAADFGAVVSAPALGERVAGATVILFTRPAGRGVWAEADRAVTNSYGLVLFRARPRVTSDFAAESLPADGFAGGLSGVLRVKVRR
jgi:hypothetical protein